MSTSSGTSTITSTSTNTSTSTSTITSSTSTSTSTTSTSSTSTSTSTGGGGTHPYDGIAQETLHRLGKRAVGWRVVDEWVEIREGGEKGSLVCGMVNGGG